MPALSWAFGYDAAGNRTQLTQPNGTTTTYAYLTNNWLAAIAHAGPGGPFQTISYTYDTNGNRITQTDSSGATTFGYDVLNRLTQAAYSYDPNGNLTGTSAGQSFTYDPFNRMTQAVGVGGTASYTYNGDGLKVQRVGPDGATRYYYDGIRPIWETDGAGVMTAQLDRDIFGNLLSRAEPGNRRYYHTDGLGSTVALTDETGTTAASMLYDAWGNVRASSGSGHGKYRFTGAELDTASDLYHMGARFYNPLIGRWLSEDPVQGGYTYVANNPLGLIDPTGMMEGDSNSCDAACENARRNAAAAAAGNSESLSSLAWSGAEGRYTSERLGEVRRHGASGVEGIWRSRGPHTRSHGSGVWRITLQLQSKIC